MYLDLLIDAIIGGAVALAAGIILKKLPVKVTNDPRVVLFLTGALGAILAQVTSVNARVRAYL